MIDIIGALLGLAFLVPLTFVVWIANVIAGDNRCVFYKHTRIGKNGKEFKMYKFRTMCKNANNMVKDEETMKRYFSPEQIKEWQENYKITGDPRITKIGNFLRRSCLDEMPQVINVLKGDLSIIGPRPVIYEEAEKYGENKAKFLSVTPGLTGYWAANRTNNMTYKERMEMELYYVENMSILLDIKIFFKTIVTVIKGLGVK